MIGTQHSPFFRLASRLLKYFLLAVFGFVLACILPGTFGAVPIALLIWQFMGPWLLRLAVVVGCVITVAVIIESLRH
jgi:membrane protein YqaA with SNARE-associated domain